MRRQKKTSIHAQECEVKDRRGGDKHKDEIWKSQLLMMIVAVDDEGIFSGD